MIEDRKTQQKKIGNIIRLCMSMICGMQNNKYKQPKFVENSAMDSVYYKAVSMIDNGKFCEAENYIYEELNPEDSDESYVMLCIYDYMNDLPDTFIEAGNFSRQEIREGIDYIIDKRNANFITYLLGDEYVGF